MLTDLLIARAAMTTSVSQAENEFDRARRIAEERRATARRASLRS